MYERSIRSFKIYSMIMRVHSFLRKIYFEAKNILEDKVS